MNSPAVSREFSPQRFPRQKLVARRVRLGPPEPLEVRLLGHHAVQVLVQRVEQHLGVAVKKDIFLLKKPRVALEIGRRRGANGLLRV
jgi:hypothetical protein